MEGVDISTEDLQGKESKCSSTLGADVSSNQIPVKTLSSKSSIPRLHQRNPCTSKSFVKENVGFKNEDNKGLRSKSCAENYFRGRRPEKRNLDDKTVEKKSSKRIPRAVSLTRYSNLHESSEAQSVSICDFISRDSHESKTVSNPSEVSCNTLLSQHSCNVVKSENVLNDVVVPIGKVSSVPTAKPTLIRKSSGENINLLKRTPQSPEKYNLERTYMGKRKYFITSRAEIYEKQKPLIRLYYELKNMKQKIEEKSGKVFPLEELKLIVPEELEKVSNANVILAKPVIEEMENSLKEIIESYLDQCRKIIGKQSEHLDFLFKDPSTKNVTIRRQLEIYRKENVELDTKLIYFHKGLEEKVKILLIQWNRLHQIAIDAEDKMANETQKETNAILFKLNTTLAELEKTKRQKNELEKKYNDAMKTVEEKNKMIENLGSENEKKRELMPNIQTNNTKLKYAKQRVRELEIKNKEQEQRMELLNVKIKRLEEQWRAQEAIFESRTQEILKSAMLKESVVNRIEKHKNNVEIRVKELEHILEETINNYSVQIRDLQDSYDMAHKEMMICNVEKTRTESKFYEVRDRLVEMEIKQLESVEMAKRNQIIGFGVNKSNALTQTELELWTELQNTRRALKKAEDDLIKKNEEKALFMETIENTVTNENSESNELYVAKIIQKDEKINFLQNRIDDLSDAVILSQNVASKQEKKISDLKNMVEVLMNPSSRGDVNYMEQENRDSLEKAMKKNNDLEQKLILKDRALKISDNRLQHLRNLLKVRDGVIGIMKSKNDITDSEHYKNYVNDLITQHNEVNAKLAQKTEQLDQINLKLESERSQMARLKKSFKSLEILVQETTAQNNELQEKVSLYHKLLKDKTSIKDIS